MGIYALVAHNLWGSHVCRIWVFDMLIVCVTHVRTCFESWSRFSNDHDPPLSWSIWAVLLYAFSSFYWCHVKYELYVSLCVFVGAVRRAVLRKIAWLLHYCKGQQAHSKIKLPQQSTATCVQLVSQANEYGKWWKLCGSPNNLMRYSMPRGQIQY